MSVNPASNFPFAPAHTKHRGGPGWGILRIQISNALVSYKKSKWVQSHSSSWGHYLQLCLEEKLLWTLCAVIDLVFLSMGRENMLLQLVCLNKHWNDKTWWTLGYFLSEMPWVEDSTWAGPDSQTEWHAFWVWPLPGTWGGLSHLCLRLGLWLSLRCTLPST